MQGKLQKWMVKKGKKLYKNRVENTGRAYYN